MTKNKNAFLLGCVRAFLLVVVFLVSIGALPALGADFTSSNFIVRDPVTSAGGERATSLGFEYFSSTFQTIIGEATSGSFAYRSGFLYFSTSVLSQNTFRWYENTDAIQPTTAKAAENTAITGINNSDVLRLRLSVKASREPFAKNKLFKLQFADKGSAGSCSAVSSGSFTDVGSGASVAVWRGFNNSSVADGATITSRLLTTAGSTGSSQTYEEENNSATSPDFIYVGTNADAEWDWVIQNNNATAGATYCFRQVFSDGTTLNAYTNHPSLTTTAAAPPPPPPPPPAGGGGGGGGFIPPPPPPPAAVTTVIFTGRAYPSRTVTLLKDAQVAATTIAGADSLFSISLTGLSGGNYIFSVYSEDKDGIRSSLLTFPVSVTQGATTTVSGIFIAPTIEVDKEEVRRGDNIAIFGQTTPSADITIVVNSSHEHFVATKSDAQGVYLYNFDTAPLEVDNHSTKSKAAKNGEISSFSQAVSFRVGDENIAKAKPVACPQKADLNGDCKVNLVDFSIAAFWYRRTLSADFRSLELAKLNGDGKVDIVDFSIMAFYWTG